MKLVLDLQGMQNRELLVIANTGSVRYKNIPTDFCATLEKELIPEEYITNFKALHEKELALIEERRKLGNHYKSIISDVVIHQHIEKNYPEYLI